MNNDKDASPFRDRTHDSNSVNIFTSSRNHTYQDKSKSKSGSPSNKSQKSNKSQQSDTMLPKKKIKTKHSNKVSKIPAL